MPISRKEFEKGEFDLSFLIMDFLRTNPDYAFTLEELIVEMASRRVPLTREETKKMLEALEAAEKIEIRVKQGKGIEYYIYHKARLGFRG